MLDSTELVIIVIGSLIVLGPPIVGLIAMRRHGRRWARTRLVAYPLTAAFYAFNCVMLMVKSNGFGACVSGGIAWGMTQSSYAAWRAYRRGDYRPAHLRKDETPPTTPTPEASVAGIRVHVDG